MMCTGRTANTGPQGRNRMRAIVPGLHEWVWMAMWPGPGPNMAHSSNHHYPPLPPTSISWGHGRYSCEQFSVLFSLALLFHLFLPLTGFQLSLVWLPEPTAFCCVLPFGNYTPPRSEVRTYDFCLSFTGDAGYESCFLFVCLFVLYFFQL